MVVSPSDLLKYNHSLKAYTSKGNWGSANVSLGWRAPVVCVVYLPAVPSIGLATAVFVVYYESK